MNKKPKFQVLSPDGITIEFDKFSYPTRAKAIEAFEKWKQRYEFQGYYSSGRHGRIPLEDLHEYCTIKEI